MLYFFLKVRQNIHLCRITHPQLQGRLLRRSDAERNTRVHSHIPRRSPCVKTRVDVTSDLSLPYHCRCIHLNNTSLLVP